MLTVLFGGVVSAVQHVALEQKQEEALENVTIQLLPMVGKHVEGYRIVYPRDHANSQNVQVRNTVGL